MADYLIKSSTLSGIANAIRSKSGTDTEIPVSNMAPMINQITTIDGLIERSICEIVSDAELVSDYAFYENNTIIGAYLPKAVSVGRNAFTNCTKLTSVYLPMATSIGINGFANCSLLKSVYIPNVTTLSIVAFSNCSSIESLNLPLVSTLDGQALYNCSSLKSLILRAPGVVTINGSTVLKGTPIEAKTGYIYVPRALVDSYKADDTWKSFSTQIRALEDYTVNGTASGELDKNKI